MIFKMWHEEPVAVRRKRPARGKSLVCGGDGPGARFAGAKIDAPPRAVRLVQVLRSWAMRVAPAPRVSSSTGAGGRR